MSRIHKTHQLLAALLLVVLLIPMLAIDSYASAKVGYRFDFVENYQKSAQKNDVGTSGGRYAGASITEARFNLGNARFYLLDAEGNRATDYSARYTTEYNSIPFEYYSGAALYSDCYVTLVGLREGNTEYVKGNFQP